MLIICVHYAPQRRVQILNNMQGFHKDLADFKYLYF
jgi:hypothetical protein